MASQQGPPSRPWFRLATMVRPPTPQPDQPPPPRPALTIRQAFSQAPPPPQPQPQPPAANVVPPAPPSLPSSNPRTSPLMQQSVQATSPPPPSRSTPPSLTATMPPTTNSLSPPKTVKTSPNNKPLSHPPSPMALPSPQLKSYYVPEYDQKSVLVQETKQKQPKGLDNGDLRRHMTPDTHNPTKKTEASKKHLDSEDDVGMRIITIAGENKGAIMELTPFGNKTSHKFGKKDNPTTASSSTDGDSTNSKANNKNQKPPLIMNSNVQAVNNSILYNCSTTHHDPGIHFSLSTNPTGGRRSLHKDHMHKLND